jgi:hypothetical protein
MGSKGLELVGATLNVHVLMHDDRFSQMSSYVTLIYVGYQRPYGLAIPLFFCPAYANVKTQELLFEKQRLWGWFGHE